MNADLRRIGWRIEEDRLVPVSVDVRELFFSKDTQHEAYVEVRRLFQQAKSSITVIDPYLDSSVFTMLKTIFSQYVKIHLLTSSIPKDFCLEAHKFLSQSSKFKLEVRRSREFHDRFIILDGIDCWHVGCSIKDAGNKAFMLSKIEDQNNQDALIAQLEKRWSTAEIVNIPEK